MWHRKPFTVPTDLSHLIFHQSSSNTLWPCPLNCALLPENTKLRYGHLSPAHQTHLSLLQLLWTHSSFEIWLQGHCLFATSPNPYRLTSLLSHSFPAARSSASTWVWSWFSPITLMRPRSASASGTRSSSSQEPITQDPSENCLRNRHYWLTNSITQISTGLRREVLQSTVISAYWGHG